MRKHLPTLILSVSVAFCAIIALLLGFLLTPKAASATITGPGFSYSVSLSEDHVFEVEGKMGEMLIEVKDGKIGVKKSGCPNQYCVHQGYRDGGASIVCAYNEVMIGFQASDYEVIA